MWISIPEADARIVARPEMERHDIAEFFAQIRSTIPVSRQGTVAETAAAVAFVAEVEPSYVAGQMISVDGSSSMVTGDQTRVGR